MLERLEDAAACIDKALARPAVVLAGIATEHLVKLAERSLNKFKAVALPCRKGKREPELLSEVDAHVAEDHRAMALNALCARESVRDRRNDAAHRSTAEFSLEEADEWLLSATRAVDALRTTLIEVDAPPSPTRAYRPDSEVPCRRWPHPSWTGSTSLDPDPTPAASRFRGRVKRAPRELARTCVWRVTHQDLTRHFRL